MTKLMKALMVAVLMAAILTGYAVTVKADPTPCTVGCDGGH